jgi:hypothetical protein
MDSIRGAADVHLLFVKPDGTGDGFDDTDLMRSARAIPDVDVRVDDRGAEAAQFRAATSGQTLLYDARGHLLFAGGITVARGHEGENAGVTRIVSLIKSGISDGAATAVYGCPLQDPG